MSCHVLHLADQIALCGIAVYNRRTSTISMPLRRDPRPEASRFADRWVESTACVHVRSDRAKATTKTMSGGSDRGDAAAAAAAQPNMRRGRVRKVRDACPMLCRLAQLPHPGKGTTYSWRTASSSPTTKQGCEVSLA